MRRLILSVTFPALAWFVGGLWGLAAGAAIIVSWWSLDLPRRVYWALSVALLVASPIALVIEGLPDTQVVGAGFGVQHLVAHRLVLLSIALAAFAALTEVLSLDRRLGKRAA